jgi:HSP20 family protein
MALIPFWSERDIDRELEDENLTDWPAFGLMKISSAPKVDVYEKGDTVVTEAELPGFKPEQITAEIKDNALVIEAKAEEEKEEGDKKKGYWRKETSRGYMKRVVSLPVEVVADKAEAEFENGVLKIKVPKAQPRVEEAKAKKLEIKRK